MSKEQTTPNAEEQLPVLKYTEEQAREIYNEGQKTGYIAAIKNIRANINDYLDNLIVAANTPQSKGE